MATAQFKGESPYKGVLDRSHDSSDYKYQRYSEIVSKEDESVKRVFGFAIFGLGRAGSIHLANMLGNPRVEIKYIVESNKDMWDNIRKRWNLKDTKFIHPDDVDCIYKDPSVEAVVISTPTFTHEPFIVGSLESGKAVFSEKPIAESKENTKRCYEKSLQVRKPLFCAFNRRFDPTFQGIREQVRKGAVGHVNMVKTTSRDSPLPTIDFLKNSGGIFHDCAVHDIDMVTWLVGEYPVQVFSVANAQIPEIAAINDWDNVAITLKFDSGTIGLIDLCRYSNYGYDQRVEVFGLKGMLHALNDKPTKAVLSDASGSSQVPMYYSFPSRYADGYIREMEHFLNVMEGKVEMSVTGRMTSAVSKIADACETSAKTGKPVDLTWSDDELPPEFVQKRTA